MKKFHLKTLLFTFLCLFAFQQIGTAQCSTAPAGAAAACPVAGSDLLGNIEDFGGGLGIFTQSTTDDLNWTVDANGTGSGGTGPSDDFCGGGNYLYVETSFPATNNDVACITTTVDLTAGAAGDPALLSFQFNANGACIGSLDVSIDGGASTNVVSGNQGDVWTQYTQDIAAVNGTMVNVEICYTVPAACPAGSVFNGDIAIDDFVVFTCSEPCLLVCEPAITISNDPGICGAMVTVPNPTPSGPCAAIVSVAALNFDSGIPAGWTNAAIGTNAAAVWMNGDGTVGNGGLTVDGSDLMFFDDDDIDTNGGDVAQITTTSFDLTGLTGVQVDFDYIFRALGASFFQVEYSSDGGATWNTILTQNTTTGTGVGTPVPFTAPIPNADATANFQLRFTYDDGNGWQWYAGFDNLEISAAAATVEVTNDFNGTTDASGMYPVGTTTVTFTVLDEFGSPVTCSTDIVVTDDEAATFTCPSDVIFHLDPGACDQVYGYTVGVTDNCPLMGAPISATTNNDFSAASVTNSVSCAAGLSTYLVYDLASLGVTTDLNLSSLDFFIFQMFSAGTITANIYTIPSTTTPLTLANLTTLVASGSAMFGAVPTGATPASIPLTGTVPAGSVVVIELATPGTTTSGFIPGYSAAGLSSGTTFVSGCGGAIPEIATVSSLIAGFTDEVVFQLSGSAPLEPTQTSGLASGEAFPIGVTTNTFSVTDAAGNVSTCSWDVTVVEHVVTSEVMVCNNNVNVSLDETCQAVLGADQILEGNTYGCYDNYTVTFADGPNMGQPVTLSGANSGQTINVMVTSPTGVPCWGSILVEDKLIPSLVCEDVAIGCADDATPGSSFAVAANQAFPTVTVPLVAGTTTETLDAAQGGVIDDVNVSISTNHTWVGDLVITVTSPAGTSVELLNNLGGPGFGCNNPDTDPSMVVLMDDEAANTYADMDALCPPNGDFQPLEALSAFDGEDITGTWTVDVQDLVGGDGGDVDVVLNISATGGATFPVPATATVTPAGPNTFTVTGFDPCGPATLTFADTEGGDLCSGTQQIVRNWTITDGSNNSNSCTQTITIIPATIDDVAGSLPGDISLECGATLPAPITSLPGSCDNIAVTLDGPPTIIDICGGGFKMLRTYVVIDWCTNTTMDHVQVIKVEDTQGPVLTCNADMTVGTTSNGCAANVFIATPTATDCSDGTTFTAVASNGTINGNMLTNAPLGQTMVVWTATDACGNVSSCTQVITVVDNIAPIAICDEHTVVSIGNDGTATVNAITFDDGSLDNCGIVSMQVRRMDNPDCPGNDASAFGDNVSFTCCDLGSVVMVELRVEDASGNFNSCMVEAEVQDKIDPIIICPADKTIDCDEDALDLALTGEASGSDNCGNATVTFNDISNTVNDCFEGTITRVWTATDGVGRTSSCIQTITVTNSNPFDGNITFPADFTASTCGVGLLPSDLPAANAFPTFTEGDCNNIAMTFEDEQLTFGAQDACLTLLRKWIIIDWCQAMNNPDPTVPGPGVWHHTQVIKVENSNDPNIFPVNTPTVIDNFDQGCGNVFAAFSVSADDDCTAQADLDVTWEFNTGLTGTGFDASGLFANGSYSITYTVNDQCGNSSTLTHNFTVTDAKKPTPVCLFGLASTVMPSAGMVSIWASDFESGSSFDNCTAYENLQFSFSTDVTNTSMTIACADVPADGLVPVTLYVTDASGNFDFCSTFINVQDPNGVCGGPAAFISGTIQTENQEAIDDVTIDLTNASGTMGSELSNNNGQFVFPGMAYNDYDVTPEKDIDYLNGVTTYDLVLISQHILGTNLFDTPYKWIAADANHSETITTLDIVKLRALILHIDDELTNNDSWRFVDNTYAFVNNANPLADNFPEHIDLSVNGYVPANFVGIKVGDVNGTAIANSLLGTDTRTFNGKLALQLETTKVAQGETFTVDFRAKDFNDIAGYQFSLDFENVEFVDVTSNLPGLGTENFGLTKLNEGVITTSWNSSNGITVEDNDVLFTITFLANTAINTSDVFAINSRYTESEAYNGSDLFDVVLEFNGNEVAGGFELYQNTPNPFKAETTVGFNLPQAGEVTLKIYDVSGRVLRLMEIDAVKGFNSVNINRDGMDATGVLYYQLETATETATKKMILVD